MRSLSLRLAFIIPLVTGTAFRLTAETLNSTARETVIHPDRAMLDAEETYELRCERILSEKGLREMIATLAHDLAKNPRPYVKAWYANYLLYGDAFGVKDITDVKRGFALAKEARREGSPFGMELVGRAYGDGVGPGYRDSQFALTCLRQAADEGRASALCELAKYYFFGFGVIRDEAKAIELARQASWRGATTGLMNIAEWLENPKYVGKTDHAKALELYYEAAEIRETGARTLLADLAKKGDQLADKYVHLLFLVDAESGGMARPVYVKETVKWLDAHAAPDDWPVQLALAQAMIEIKGPVYDPEAARTKLTRAAAAGSDDAGALLAEMAWRGIGQSQDEAGAIARWRALADKGNACALGWVGWLSYWGNGAKYGVPKDATKAFEYSRRAADLGDWRAQFTVAGCYADGIGTPINYYLAGKYYGILSFRGYIGARKMRDRVLALVKD